MTKDQVELIRRVLGKWTDESEICPHKYTDFRCNKLNGDICNVENCPGMEKEVK